MQDKTTEIRNFFYSKNAFVKFLGTQIDEVRPGYGRTSLQIQEHHTNLAGFVHGGVIMSIADTAVGVACVAFGKKVVTLNMTTNFINNVQQGDVITAQATTISNGNRVIVMDCVVKNSQDLLLAKLQCTFYVVGEIDTSI